MVSALIKHTKFDAVKKALTEIGINGMTVTEVKGFGRQKGHTEVYRGLEYEVRFLPKIKVEVAAGDDKFQEVISAIEKTARAGDIGDGKIFVYDLKQAVRIRTGEKDEEAL